MNHYYLHLGSNLGDRKKNLYDAIRLIEYKIGFIVEKSSIYETEPWGLKDQPGFLNQAIISKSNLSPNKVLNVITDIESELGRIRNEKWGPRTIDIDIIYCDDLILNSDELTVPHPHMYDRNFVLIPFMEIAGDFIDPVKQVSVEELYDNCRDESEVFIFEG